MFACLHTPAMYEARERLAMTDENPYGPTDDPDIFYLQPGDRSLAGKENPGRSDFMFARLAGVDMSGANLYWAMFNGALLEGAILSQCDLCGAVFNEANLRGANLTGADLGLDGLGGSTDFIGADLSGAILTRARISGAQFRRALLTGADLRDVRGGIELEGRGTCFDGAELSGARLGGADLTGATYNAETRFPKGFRPDAAGMVMSGGKGR